MKYSTFRTHFSEEPGPVGLDLDPGGLDDGCELLGGDGNIVIGEDESGVDAGELRVGHCECASFLPDLAQREQGTRSLKRIHIIDWFLQE